jgi:hypothetical protein
MPLKVKKIRNQPRFKVVNQNTGRVHAYASTRENATRQVRLLNAIEHGFIPRGRPLTRATAPARRR